MTPLMFASALVQYNSRRTRCRRPTPGCDGSTSPGSELFVVYNEERDTLGARFPALTNRAFIVKVNRLFRL